MDKREATVILSAQVCVRCSIVFTLTISMSRSQTKNVQTAFIDNAMAFRQFLVLEDVKCQTWLFLRGLFLLQMQNWKHIRKQDLFSSICLYWRSHFCRRNCSQTASSFSHELERHFWFITKDSQIPVFLIALLQVNFQVVFESRLYFLHHTVQNHFTSKFGLRMELLSTLSDPDSTGEHSTI